MKKIYTLALGLCLSTFAFSQQQPEFGFILKVGNQAIPSIRYENDSYYTISSINTTKFNAGEVYALGIWQSFPLNSHFRLSGELLGRFTSFTNRKKVETFYSDGTFRIQETEKDNAFSVSLPIKLHYSFRKEGRTSIALGVGVSQTFLRTVSVLQRAESEPFPEPKKIQNFTYTDRDAGSIQLSFSTGFYYRLDATTALGIEYTFERANKAYNTNTFLQPTQLLNIKVAPSTERLIPNMNSFSVSLRHNILD